MPTTAWSRPRTGVSGFWRSTKNANLASRGDKCGTCTTMERAMTDGTQAANLTEFLAFRATNLRYGDIPEPARALAKQCVLDYLGVAIAGADDPLVRILLDEVAESGGTPQASMIGHGARLPVLSATLVNGAAAHALDYDDVNMAMPGHP